MILFVLSSLAPDQQGWGRNDAMRVPCDTCHTMHNSELNSPLVTPFQSALLNKTCNGCHTGLNTSTSMPFVHTASGVVYDLTGTEAGARNTLAGGNFYWTLGNSRTGHNVDGIAVQDVRTAPGGDPSVFYSDTTPLTCAGQYGCHGDPGIVDPFISMLGAHHADDSLPINGSTIGRSYRFLNGVIGLEDPDWEFSVDSSLHNQYKGAARGTDEDLDPSAISHVCARCHGAFHDKDNGGVAPGTSGVSFASPWLRHPVDYDMFSSTSSEYSGYGGGIGTYMPQTPLGSAVIPLTPNANVWAAGDAVITCITCHRAHGSPYNSSLRWNYKDWPGSGYNGCGDCHTAKN